MPDDSGTPRAYLPYRLEATSGAPAVVVFRVEDDSLHVQATLRLAGSVERTFTCTAETNTDVRIDLPRKLKAGRYEVVLSAVDSAGNTTAQAASRTMIVKPQEAGASSAAAGGTGTAAGTSESGGSDAVDTPERVYDLMQGFHSIDVGVGNYALDHNGAYPPEDYVTQSRMDFRYIDEWPVNPYTNLPMSPGIGPGDYTYTLEPDGSYTLVAFGANGQIVIAVP